MNKDNTMQTTIRLARPDDFTAWLPLWQGYQAFYKTAIPLSVTELTWARWLTHESNTDAMHLYDKVADKSGFVQYRKLLPQT